MIALLASVLFASLVGSAHCAGMCGGIAAFCGGVGQCSGRASSIASCVYHVSRFASYVFVGALAGACGVLLNSGGGLVGVQHIAAIAAGIAVALVGVGMLLQSAGIDSGRVPLPLWMKRSLGAIHKVAATMQPTPRALVIGLATPLLPCGWLWAFAAVAAGTGRVVEGALVMAAFWLGTVPILALVGAGIASLGGQKRRILAAIAGAFMIAVGVYTAGVRAPLAEVVATRLSEKNNNNHSQDIRSGAVGDEFKNSTLSNIANGPHACCKEMSEQ